MLTERQRAIVVKALRVKSSIDPLFRHAPTEAKAHWVAEYAYRVFGVRLSRAEAAEILGS